MTPTDLSSAGVAEQWRDRIHRYILRMVRDPEEAEDLTQETFVRVHRKLESLQDPATLSTWLFRIATNVCRDHFRRLSPRSAVASPDAASDDEASEIEDRDAPRVHEVIDRAEMSSCVREYIEGLSDSYRTVILLHDLEGMTSPQIAQALGCSLPTVKIRLHRARLRLKEALKVACDFSRDECGTLICNRKPTSD
jgi:RNA polymerase sigma-70 factor (ECF subfamily)